MLRYICQNSDCLHTFLSPHLEKFKKCELCGRLLIHVGKPEKDIEPLYPRPIETIEYLKTMYVRLRKRARNFGLTEEECLIVGRCIRKISFEERKKLLIENGLWEEGVIYRHIVTKEGLSKRVMDKRAMYYKKNEEKKDEK